MRRLKWLVGAVCLLGLMAVLFGGGAREPGDEERPAPGARKSAPRPPRPSTPPPQPAKPLITISTDEFAALLAREIGEAPPAWERIEVSEAQVSSGGRVRAAIIYAGESEGPTDVREDTLRLLRACVAVLKSKGVRPLDHRLFIFCEGRLNEDGETGPGAGRPLGKSIYNPFLDSTGFQKDG